MDASSFLVTIFLVSGIGAVWVLRRSVGLPKLGFLLVKPKPSFPMELVGRLHLSNQHSIQIVRVGSRLLVVGLAGSSMTVLDTLASEDGSGLAADARSPRRAA